MKMEGVTTLGRQRVSALVLEAEKTANGDRVKTTIQILGGPSEKVFPKLDEATVAKVKPGAMVQVDCQFSESSTVGERKYKKRDGSEGTERVKLYEMRAFLVVPETAPAKAAA